MWEYRQDINLETSVKMSPYCHSWQSACWFFLKGVDMWKFLVSDRSTTYHVIMSIFLIGLFWILFRWVKRKRSEVPMSEIRSLRDRVQYVSEDIVKLQDALDAAKSIPSISHVVIDQVNAALHERKEEEEGNEQESNEQMDVKPPESFEVPESDEIPDSSNAIAKKPPIKPKPIRSLSSNRRNTDENANVENDQDQKNLRRRQNVPSPSWKI
ncbi:uncharacterized protein LOC108086924 [Drosophila ficusphila]|uniref:uncharacterized protein LOC108086924 n=1 Tax=Drosophila ficusphila TaxID=30025 RepID=UPI0007E7AC64|nr:uncharacterized protein LOC108086924 [Drosophila ficusphila]